MPPLDHFCPSCQRDIIPRRKGVEGAQVALILIAGLLSCGFGWLTALALPFTASVLVCPICRTEARVKPKVDG
jgi:hypothetical protein